MGAPQIGNVSESVAGLVEIQNAGAPSAGTSEVNTLTIGGTPTAGAGSTFKLGYSGLTTAAILWSATNGTLLANIQAALDALLGTNVVVAAAVSLTAGVGTISLTFGGRLAVQAVTTITVADNSLTGTAPTLAIAKTTPGVNATGRNLAKGALLRDITNGILYQNTGTNVAPTWSKVGAET